MKKSFLFLIIFILPFVSQGQIIRSSTESSRFLTAYSNGAPNDSIFVFCTPGTASLTANMTGGTAPYTFTWYKYNTTTHVYPGVPYATIVNGSTSTISALASGGYRVVITDATAAVMGCDVAWVWNMTMTADAGANIASCTAFNMAGSASTSTFKYYNPQASSLIIGASTNITVCLDVVHTFVSDMSFHLIGPASCGSPDILLSPNPGSNGQGNFCNGGADCSNLCFSNISVANLNVCTALTPLTGTYGRYGAGAGTAINWSALIGCNAATGGWRIRIYDCFAADVGTLTDATISFSNPATLCGPDNVSYYTGIVNSSITDNACTAGSASTFTVPTDTVGIAVTNTNSFQWTAVPATTITNSTTISPTVPTPPAVNTTFFLTVTSNHGCSVIDSLHYTPCVVFGNIIYSNTESSRFLTSYTNGSSNDSVFVFCAPSASPILKVNMTGGVAPYTFKWYQYNTTSHIFPLAPFSTVVNASISTISGLVSGGYKVVITDANGTVMGCDQAWVWNLNMSTDAGNDFSGCAPFSLSGSINMNSTATFKYYNPQADSMIINSATAISVCFNVIHTYVSDLAFHLVGPAACGSPDILLSPNPGAIGESATCNSGDNTSNLCFTSLPAPNLDVCNPAPVTLTGTYDSYGPIPGTLINWSPLYGCNASNGGWTVQVYDCTNLDVGTLTDATISFSGIGLCGQDYISYYSGIVNSPINDNTCTPGTASIYSAPLDTTPIIVTNINTFAWTAVPIISISNSTTSLTPAVPTAPLTNTTFFLTVNSNHGCTKTDSVHFIYVAGTPPTITPVAPVCSNGGSVALSGNPAGGTFSGSGVAGNSFNPTGLSGNVTITYAVGTAGCLASNTTTVTITPLPVATFSYTGTPYCSNGTNPSPTFNGGGVAGTFTSTAGLVFVSAATGQINLSASTAGVYTVTNTLAAAGACPSVTATSTVTITAAPDASFSYVGGTFCRTGGMNPPPTFTGNGGGGTFTSTPAGLSINASTGVVTPSTSTVGTYTVTNTIPATAGCAGTSATATIVIIQNQVAGFTYANNPYCQFGANPFPTFNPGGVAGTFTSSPAGLSFVSTTTGEVNLSTSTPGTYSVTNHVPATASCLAANASSTITITELPVATFNYPGISFCIGVGIVSANFIGAGQPGIFTCSSPNLVMDFNSGDVDVSSSTPGNYWVYNLLPAADGCPDVLDSAEVIITTGQSATFNYAGSPYCQAGSTTSPTFTGGGIAGTFTATPAGLSINPSTGAVDLSTSALGTYTVTNSVPASGSCSASSANNTITIVSGLVATFSYTASPYCQSGTDPSPTYSGGGVAGTFTASPAGLTINASTGQITLASSTPNTYTVTNTIAASGSCPQVVATSTITVIPPPVATFSYTGTPYCSNGGSIPPTYSGGGMSGTFTAAPVGLTINPATGVVTLSTSTCGTYTVTNTVASAGCPNAVATANITITCLPVATFSYTATPYCQSGIDPSPTFSGGGVAGTFSVSPAGLTINSSTGQITLASSTCGTYTVTNSIAASGGCAIVTSTATITVTCAPVATFSYTGTPYCINGTDPLPTYSGGGVAGTFTATPAGLTINAVTGQVTLASSLPNTYTVTNTLPASGGCGIITATSTITITALPVATFSYTASPYCQSGVDPLPTFNGGGIAGTFTATPAGLTINPATGLITLASSLANTYTVTNIIAASGGCSAVGFSTTITVIATPVATFSYTATPYCINGVDPSPTFSGGGIAGTFTASPAGLTINSSTGVVTLSTSACGSYTVTNTVSAGGCPNVVATTTITVTCLPVASFSYTASPFCQSGIDPLPTFNGGGIAGTFTSSPAGLTINAVTGQITLASSTCGSYTVTNTVAASGGCAQVAAITIVTITCPAVATFSYTATPYCINAADPSPTFSGGGVAGTFTATPAGLTINAATGQVTISTSLPNTYTVTNTLPASGGCGIITATSTITITAIPVATFSYTASPYCQSGVDPLPTFNGGGIAGTFTATPVGLTINPATGLITLASSLANTYTVTNIIAATGGCSAVGFSTTITITATPVATFSYTATPYCMNGANPLPTFSGGGVAGTFSCTPGLNFVSTATGEINLATSTPGIYTVTNTVLAGVCPNVVATSTVTLTALPVATFNYTATPYCQNGIDPSPTFSGGGVAGTFSSTPGLIINSVTGLITLASSTCGTYTVTNTVAASGGCPQVTASTNITILCTPVATFSYTATPYCMNGGNPLPTFSGGGVAGTFSSTPGLNFVSTSTGEIDLTTSSAGIYTVTNTVLAGACPDVVATSTVTLTALPVATFSYTATPYCQNGTDPSPTFGGGGVAGTFSSTPGLTINSVTGLISLTTSTCGIYTVTNTIAAAGGCPQVTATANVTILCVPVGTFSYTGTPYCQNAVNPSPTFVAGATAGAFTAPAGLTVDVNTGVVDLINSTAGTYMVTNTIAAVGGCAAAVDSSSITIVAAPTTGFSYVGSPYCIGGSNPSPTLIAGAAAGTYTSTPAGLTIDALTGTVDLTTSLVGTYTITNTIAAGVCPADSSTATIVISPLPIANAGANSNFVCGTPTDTLDGTLSSSGVNIVYLWTTPDGHIVSGSTTTTPVVDSAGTYIITVTDTASNCSATDSVSVTGSAGPTAAFSANSLIGDAPLTVNFTNTSTGGNNYFWTFGTGDTSLVLNPNYIYTLSGTYTVILMVSDTLGCNDTASETIIVHEGYTITTCNVFSPNGDGINDLFYITATGVEILEGDIYDRWGVKIFTFHAPKEGWDGRTIAGQPAIAGTYYYVIKTTGFDGTEHEDKGFFVLVR